MLVFWQKLHSVQNKVLNILAYAVITSFTQSELEASKNDTVALTL